MSINWRDSGTVPFSFSSPTVEVSDALHRSLTVTCQVGTRMSGHTWPLVTLPTPPALHPHCPPSALLLPGSGSPCRIRLSHWDWLRVTHTCVVPGHHTHARPAHVLPLFLVT